MLPFRTLVAACVLLAAAPAAASSDALVWVQAATGPVDVDAAFGEEYQVFVDGAAREAGEAGAPVSSTDGDVALEAGDERIPLDPEARPGGVAVEPRTAASVLADGWTLPASFPLEAAAGVASDGHAVYGLAPTTMETPPARDTTVATPTSTATGGAAPYVPGPSGAAPGLQVGTTPAAGETYRPKPVSTASPSTYAPSAVALAPVDDGGAKAAAAAGVLAIGLLLTLWPLYHRLRGAETLESATRKRIYDVVCARAGAGVAEVALKGGVSYSTATYHLDRLVEAGMLVASHEGAKLRYYKNGTLNEADRKLVPLLENAEVMRLLGLIRENPGTYRAALADALNVTTTTVNWHLKRLTQAGLVREERKGRSAHLYAVEERLASLPALGARLAVTTDDAKATN